MIVLFGDNHLCPPSLRILRATVYVFDSCGFISHFFPTLSRSPLISKYPVVQTCGLSTQQPSSSISGTISQTCHHPSPTSHAGWHSLAVSSRTGLSNFNPTYLQQIANRLGCQNNKSNKHHLSLLSSGIPLSTICCSSSSSSAVWLSTPSGSGHQTIKTLHTVTKFTLSPPILSSAVIEDVALLKRQPSTLITTSVCAPIHLSNLSGHYPQRHLVYESVNSYLDLGTPL